MRSRSKGRAWGRARNVLEELARRLAPVSLAEAKRSLGADGVAWSVGTVVE